MTSDAGPGDPATMRVAVGIVRDALGRFLIARRPPGVHLGGRWEFPGGKVRAGECARAALARELREEVGIRVKEALPLIAVPHRYPERSVRLEVWEVRAWSGAAHGREGQAIEWVAYEELRARDLPPADRPIVCALGLPDRYLVTPEPPVDPRADERFLEGLATSLDRGVRLVQLRVKRERAGLAGLVHGVAGLCAGRGARVLLNLPEPRAPAGGDGVHLTAARLLARTGPVVGEGLVGASCHDAAELAHAARVGVDFAVLGPVRATATHPGAPALGWARFDTLAADATIPVYALGGMAVGDVEEARRRGGQGIAAIRGLWGAA